MSDRRCWKCDGKGYAMSSYPAKPVTCSTCEGTGKRRSTGEPYAETDPENWPDGRPTYGRGR